MNALLQLGSRAQGIARFNARNAATFGAEGTPLTVSAPLLRAKFDHIDEGVSKLNETYDNAYIPSIPVDQPAPGRIISLLSYIQWKTWAEQWKLFYANNRPSAIQIGDVGDWLALDVQEKDFLGWRKWYLDESGKMPPSYVLSPKKAGALDPAGGFLKDIGLPLGIAAGALLLWKVL